jgi:hypothetical protein
MSFGIFFSYCYNPHSCRIKVVSTGTTYLHSGARLLGEPRGAKPAVASFVPGGTSSSFLDLRHPLNIFTICSPFPNLNRLFLQERKLLLHFHHCCPPQHPLPRFSISKSQTHSKSPHRISRLRDRLIDNIGAEPSFCPSLTQY